MFETINYRSVDFPTIPVEVYEESKLFRKSVRFQSQIVWGEHCSECAFPNCYSSCSFYTPRPDDLHCGRFENGIQKTQLGDIRFAMVNFRKWGRLFGKGPVGLISVATAVRREKRNELVSNIIAKFVPYLAVRRINWEWDRRKAKSAGYADADAFVIEAYTDSSVDLHFTLTIIPQNSDNSGLFQTSVIFKEGYNRKSFSVAQMSKFVDLAQEYTIQIEPLTQSLGCDVAFGLIDFVKLENHLKCVEPASRKVSTDASQTTKPKAKCVVWDLDNTLWEGTLAEDGVEQLLLNPQAKAAVEELDRRGILNSIASKNDLEPALDALERFGLREYFLYPQISWGPKSEAVLQIAQLLDIGIDTFVFVDDQPFERGEVQERVPAITVLPHTEIPGLLDNPLFDLPVTEVSKGRRAMYMAENRRQTTFSSGTTDYDEFLRGCEIQLQVCLLSDDTAERAYELSQRTNQLNVSGRRYERAEIAALQEVGTGREAILFSCRDRFGDYGIIAMCVVNLDNGFIESFMMSCRVQRKRVEHAIFSWICLQCAKNGVDELTVEYRKTARNDASVKIFEALEFRYESREQDNGQFVRRVSTPVPDADIVGIQEGYAVE